MQCVFLYGRPAVGKLTIAREVSRLTGFRLFDNHLVVDTALALFDFGSPSFVALRENLWRASFAEMIKAAPSLAGVIFTFSPEDTVSQKFIDDLFKQLIAAQIDVRCVELTCPEEVIEKRIANADRNRKRKLVDLSLYRTLRDRGTFDTPVIDRNRLVIDSSKSPAEAAAEEIVASLRTN
jgi:hypothetical protein